MGQGVEWSKYILFENPTWRTAAMYHIYNILVVIYNVVNYIAFLQS